MARPLPLALRRLWPDFDDPAEEARFRAVHRQDLVRRLSVYAPLAISFVIASGIGHVVLFPRHVWGTSVALHVLLMLLPLALAWRVARRPDGVPHVYRAMLLAAASVSLGVCLVIAGARADGYPMPYEGGLLVIMSIFLLSGLSARDATLVALACLGGIVAIEWTWPASTETALVRTFFGLALWLLGSVFSQFIEQADRRDFRHAETLQALAHQDPLTGTLNRRGLDARYATLAAALRREGRPLTVAVVDVDHFKAYNDTYGHEAGDAVLTAVSSVLKGHARRPLDLVARLGGEEFLLAWHDVDADRGRALAGQACTDIAALALPHRGAPDTGVVTVSIGVTTTGPGEVPDLDHLYRTADQALYAAKQGGRNRVVAAT